MPSPTFQLYTSILHLRSLPLLLRCAAPRGSTQHAAHSFFFMPGFILLLLSDCWGGLVVVVFFPLRKKNAKVAEQCCDLVSFVLCQTFSLGKQFWLLLR